MSTSTSIHGVTIARVSQHRLSTKNKVWVTTLDLVDEDGHHHDVNIFSEDKLVLFEVEE